ncbi:MAG: hypothetical protein EOM67_15850 [Spirochaetia bacterium]|nr:hypothetical protein [Spirochaetia bacterium]
MKKSLQSLSILVIAEKSKVIKEDITVPKLPLFENTHGILLTKPNDKLLITFLGEDRQSIGELLVTVSALVDETDLVIANASFREQSLYQQLFNVKESPVHSCKVNG